MRISRTLIVSFLFVGLLTSGSIATQAHLDVSVSFDLFSPPPVAVAPPPLPVYVVPQPPQGNYVWAPGHWRWGPYGYFWVPGTWVQPPQYGYLWTPGYWGWNGGNYTWHEGYWGQHVGFYGGINYGGGYGGSGFNGGHWNNGSYTVNRSVTNVTNVTNVTKNYGSSASFNGGPGGVTAQPNAAEQSAMRESHIAPTSAQTSQVKMASQNKGLEASFNHGRPAIAATAKPGDFTHGVVAARQAGPRNPAAEEHAAQIRSNPQLAHGSAVPKEAAQGQGNKGEPAVNIHSEAGHQPQADAAYAPQASHSQPKNAQPGKPAPQHPQAPNHANPHPGANSRGNNHPHPQQNTHKPQSQPDHPKPEQQKGRPEQ